MARFFNRQVWRRLFNRIPAESGPITLDHQRVFILPTRHGLLFGVVLLLMLVGSINYNLSLGFVLTFLLGSMGLVSTLHTYRNLVQLVVRGGKAPAVFAGQAAQFDLHLENHAANERFSIGVRKDALPLFVDIPPGQTVCATLTLPASNRGRFRLGRFSIFTRFPLGFFHAWTVIDLGLECIIYPRPDAGALPTPGGVPETGGKPAPDLMGSDDFHGLRDYRPGDSLRHVAWKAMAQDRGMLTKQFSGQAQPLAWLDWNELAGLDTEARLSRLCRSVLDAEAAGLRYGLRLPGTTIAPGSGEAHRRSCLEALALYGIETP